MAPARRRLVLSSAALAVLAAVLAVVWPAGTASAAPAPAAETRVWAISSAAPAGTWANRLVSAGERPGEAVSCPFYAPGACVAPEAGPAARRVTLRQGTKQSVLDAQRAPDGKLYDPNTGVEIPEGGGHFGHRPGFEWWRTQQMAREQGWTRGQVIEHENDPSHYWYEDPSSNMSHQFEMPR